MIDYNAKWRVNKRQVAVREGKVLDLVLEWRTKRSGLGQEQTAKLSACNSITVLSRIPFSLKSAADDLTRSFLH